MEKTRMRILLEGRLQGMNFRYQTQQTARQLDLAGFIRTLSDGRIEIEAQGDKDKLEKLLEWCQEEPHGSQIRSILYRLDDPIHYSSFEVR